MHADQSQNSAAIGTRGLEIGCFPPPEGEMLPLQLSVGLDIDDRRGEFSLGTPVLIPLNFSFLLPLSNF